MKPGEGMIVQAVKEKPIRTPGQKRQLWVALIFLAIIAGGVFAAYKLLLGNQKSYVLKNFSTAAAAIMDLDNTAQGAGSVEVLVQLKILSEAAGYADESYVENGGKVVLGQTLARLDMPDLEKTLRKAEDSLEESLLTLDKYIIQTDFAIAKAERAIAKTKRDIADAEEELASTTKLAAAGVSSQSDIKAKLDALTQLRSNLFDAEEALAETKQIYEIDLKLKRKAIDDLEETIREYRDQLSKAVVTSPLAGDILSVNGNLLVPGSRIAASAELFTVGDPSSAQAVVEVDEAYAPLIKVGDRARLLVGGAWTDGQVSSVGKVAVLSSDGVTSTIEIKIKPDVLASSFIQGASVTAQFPLGAREGVLTLPRGAYLTTGNQKYVYVVEGDKAYRRTVAFGEIKDSLVEVSAGLKAGETVITSGYQNFIEFEEVQIIRTGGSK